MPTDDDRSAELAAGTGKVTPEQIADARELAAKMAELGVKRDLLGALVDREVLTRDEADRLRTEAASADPDGPAGAPAEAPSAPVKLPAVEKAEPVEEAAAVMETTVPGATEPASPAAATPVEEAELVEEAVAVVEPTVRGAAAAASGGVEEGRCFRHADRTAMFSCDGCGKPICSGCAIRTPGGTFCSEACFLGADAAGAPARVPVAAGPEATRRRIWPFAAAGAVALGAVLAVVFLRPSAALKRARGLKARVVELEQKGQTEKALKAARELASMTPEGGRVEAIISWGGSRSMALNRDIGLAAVDRLRKSHAALKTGDPGALSGKRRELDALAARFSDVGEVKAEIDKMRGDVDTRLAEARERAKASGRREAAGAVRAAGAAAVERRPSPAKLRVEVKGLLKARRFAEAGRAVEKARRDAGDRRPHHVTAILSELDGRIAGAAREVYLAEDRKARALVSAAKFEEARRVYRGVIDGIGVEDVAVAAHEALRSVDAAERSAAQRADLRRAEEAVAEARKLMDSCRYEPARWGLEDAGRGLRTEAARAEVGLWLDIVRREHAVLRRIVRMISAKPLDLAALESGGSKGTKGVMFEADETGYSVRVKFKAGGTSVMTSPWGRLPADQMCRLAKLAVGEEKEALVGLALFCGARGARGETAWAIGLLRRSGVVAAEGFEERYAARLSAHARAGVSEETPRKISSARASGKGGKGAGEPRASTRGTPPSGGQQKKVARAKTPRMIDVPCPCCEGDGLVNKTGCPHCEGDGYMGVHECTFCDGKGKKEYKCRACNGEGTVTWRGKKLACRRCGGKGAPSCPACKGKGTVRRPNPAAQDWPTVACAACGGEGYEQHLKCMHCSGLGKKKLMEGLYYLWIPCWICGGDCESAPMCQQCRGKGYLGGLEKPGGYSACMACGGTGLVFLPCRTCGGKGWHRSK